MNVKDEVRGAVSSTLAAMNGFEGWVEGSCERGVKALITYTGLLQIDWIIGAAYPVDEAFAPSSGCYQDDLDRETHPFEVEHVDSYIARGVAVYPTRHR